MVLIGCSCSAKKQDKSDFQIMIVEAPLQCDAEPKELRAECRCPEQNNANIATVISTLGSVVGDLISSLWE